MLYVVPLSLILRKVKLHYEFGDKKTRLNHLLSMDEMNLFAQSHGQIDSLVNTAYTFNEDIGMEYGIKKGAVFVLKRGKVDKAKSIGLNLLNGKLMKTIDEEGNKYLGISSPSLLLTEIALPCEKVYNLFFRDCLNIFLLVFTFLSMS